MFNNYLRKLPVNLTLDQIIERLKQISDVVGIIIMGSAAQGTLTVSSDLDICVVLNNPPVPIWLTMTEVEGRVSEFYFLSSKFVIERLEREKLIIKANTLEKTYLAWIATGHIVFDRTGKLGELRQKLLAGYETKWDSQAALYSEWFSINYNLRETGRLLKSSDTVVGLTFDLRTLLYGLPHLWYNYFQFRQLEWRGDKEAIRYLQQHDPAFLELVQKFISKQDRISRLEIYTRLAAIVTEPLGGLWQADDTALMVEVPEEQKDTWQVSEIADSLDFWENLLNL